MRILVIRNDKLGDFMLAWPAFRLLKEQFPEAQVIALVPDYTREMAALCPWVDEIVIDPGGDRWRDVRRLAGAIREVRPDAAIALFSSTRTAIALVLARVAYRLGPATKLAQLFLTDRLTQRRSRSEKPEYEYNADLVRHFLARHGRKTPETPGGPFLAFPAETISTVRGELSARLELPFDSHWLFVHPGSGGSANNLRPDQYLDLCRRLAGPGRAFVFTAGPGEETAAGELAAALKEYAPANVLPPRGLPALARALTQADLFISGSTGPLHIAGALDRSTATFYPGHRSGSPLRWQTLNRADIRLAFTPPPGGDPKAVSRCDVAEAAAQIEALLARRNR